MQDGALRLTAALGSGPQELVKLDLSYCGLSHHDFPKICANISLIGGLLELNLGGNYIGQEVCHFISRMPSHIVGSCVLICVVNSISGLLILCTLPRLKKHSSLMKYVTIYFLSRMFTPVRLAGLVTFAWILPFQ